MTKDLALITTIDNPTVLNSENFIKAIREELEKTFIKFICPKLVMEC